MIELGTQSMSTVKTETEEVIESILLAAAGIVFFIPWLHYEKCKKDADSGLHSSTLYRLKIGVLFLVVATLWSALAFVPPLLEYRFHIQGISVSFRLLFFNCWGIGNFLGIPVVSVGFYLSGKFKNNRSNLRTGLF